MRKIKILNEKRTHTKTMKGIHPKFFAMKGLIFFLSLVIIFLIQSTLTHHLTVFISLVVAFHLWSN